MCKIERAVWQRKMAKSAKADHCSIRALINSRAVIDVFSVEYAYKNFGLKIIAMFRLCFDRRSRTQYAYSPCVLCNAVRLVVV